jgi:hypothetical protein
MATKTPPRRDRAGDRHSELGPDIDCGPSILSLALVRLLLLAVAFGAVRLGLREWHGATFVVLFLGAAWMFGRVD